MQLMQSTKILTRLQGDQSPQIQLAMGPSDARVGRLAGKRGFDVVASTVLAVATLPLQAIGLIVSAAAFRASPVFTQQRVGADGEVFTFYKIRSLPADTPPHASKHELAKIKNSRVGTFLRKTHFDELLQFWSVIKGDMSLVGPRPEMVGLSAEYDDGFVERRTQVCPGVTGLWQISEGSKQLIGETPGYDLYYLAHRSWRLDLWILRRTVGKMLRGEMISYDDLDADAAGVFEGFDAMRESIMKLPA